MRKWFENLSISAKVILSFAVICLTTIALGVFATLQMGSINTSLVDVADNWLPSVRTLGHIAQQSERYRGNAALATLAEDEQTRKQTESYEATAQAEVVKALAAYDQLVNKGEEQKLAAQLKQDWNALVSAGEDMRRISQSGDRAAAVGVLFTTLQDRLVKFREALQADIDFNNQGATSAADAGAAAYAAARVWVIGTLIVAVVICVLAGLGIVMGVSRPILAITAVMRRLADRDMEVEIIGLGRKDEIGAMAGAVAVFKNSMIEADRLAAEQEAARAARARRQDAMDSHTRDPGSSVSGVMAALGTAAANVHPRGRHHERGGSGGAS